MNLRTALWSAFGMTLVLVLLVASMLASPVPLRAGHPGIQPAQCDPSQAPIQMTLAIRYALRAGFSEQDAKTIVAIAWAESGGKPLACNNVGNNPPDSWDQGILQINDHFHPEVSIDCAFNPSCAFQAAFAISNFCQWATYEESCPSFPHNGAYRAFLPRAQQALDQIVDVILIIDSSGSMGGNDPGTKRHEAARSYLTASIAGDTVGVVDFDSSVRLARALSILPDEKQQLIAAINTIDSSGATNIRGGIELACQELIADGQVQGRGAILLTDGRHNVGAFGNPQQCFADGGWPIFTFGFGNADQALLQTIASDTGGEFKITPTSGLVCEFQRVRSLIAGLAPGPCTAHQVNPNQTTAFPVAVPPSQAQATFSSSWTGSDVVMTLITPSGRVIDRNTTTPDVVHDKGATFEVYTVIDPESGDWQVNLFGADVPPQGEEVIFGFTTVPTTVLEVDIDIKPGSDPNSINCNNEKGVIPVALLTTEDFDATTVDHTTVAFEGASETHVDRKTGDFRRHEEDVDEDGDTDLVFHFLFDDTNLTCQSTEATLIGETFDGLAIQGTDAVRMINKGGGNK